MEYGGAGVVTGWKNRTKPTEQADDQKSRSREVPCYSEQAGEDEKSNDSTADGDAGVDAD